MLDRYRDPPRFQVLVVSRSPKGILGNPNPVSKLGNPLPETQFSKEAWRVRHTRKQHIVGHNNSGLYANIKIFSRNIGHIILHILHFFIFNILHFFVFLDQICGFWILSNHSTKNPLHFRAQLLGL